MSDDDKTPEGDEIETYTMWLTFPEGEVGLSADLTGFNAAMKRAQESVRRPSPPAAGGSL